MPRTGKARVIRIVWIVALSVLGLAILLGAAGSIFLHRVLVSGKVKEWINTDPEELRIEYASASGWTPWAVHVRGLELRNRDSNVEFWFRMDETTLSFSPLQILARRFHVNRVRGSGLVYHLRVRADPKTTPAAHFEALPPIPGFGERPLPPGEEPPKAASAETAGKRDERSGDHPFTLDIDDLRIEPVRAIWIELYRFHGGAGSVTGSFTLMPGRRAQVGPATVALSGGELSLGRHTIVKPVRFETGATIQPFDIRVVKGNAVWPYITGKASLDGPLAGLGFLNYLIAGEPRLSGGAGTARLEVDVEKGHGKGAVSLGARGFSAAYRKADLKGNAAVRVRLTDWDFEHDAIEFPGSHIELTDVTSNAPGPDSRSWWGRFDLKSASVRPGRTPPFQTKVAVHCRDARPLFTLFNLELPGWVRGLLKLEGLDAQAEVGLGPKYTRIQNLEATGGAFRIRGRDLSRQGTENGAFLIETGALAVGLEIQGGKSSLKLAGAREWFAEKKK